MLPADERKHLFVQGPAGRRVHLFDQPHAQRVGLALDPHGLERAVPHRLLRGPVGGLADQHAPLRGHRLEAGGRVHHVPRHALADLRPRAERDHRLTGVDRRPNPHAERRVGLVAFRHLILQPDRRPHGSFGVVLVSDRRTEDAQDGVPDELVERPAE